LNLITVKVNQDTYFKFNKIELIIKYERKLTLFNNDGEFFEWGNAIGSVSKQHFYRGRNYKYNLVNFNKRTARNNEF
jgi:hypothetical protein